MRKNLTAGGFTFWHHGTKKSNKAEFSKFNISADKRDVERTKPDDAFVNDQFTDLKQSTKTKDCSNKKIVSKKIKSSSVTNTFADPKKPDPNGKYKFSISQVNTMAIVSFLLIPIFILGFFIPGSLGLAVLLTALIAGVGLALFSLAIGYKRRGVWAPGIAAGFWLVILIYLSLLLFVL